MWRYRSKRSATAFTCVASILALALSGCASLNYTAKCEQLMDDCIRDCAQDASATPDSIPMCTTCKPEAERCDAQERLARQQSSSKEPSP